jgi:hypothetical protein
VCGYYLHLFGGGEPVKIVDKEAFREFCEALDPRFRVPYSGTLRAKQHWLIEDECITLNTARLTKEKAINTTSKGAILKR